MKKIVFIGAGIMKKSMVRKLMKNEFEVSIFDRNKDKVLDVIEEIKLEGIKALDAPVTGGDIGAKNGTLTILVGGNEEDYEGKAGLGQHTKLANQIMIAGAISGVVK